MSTYPAPDHNPDDAVPQYPTAPAVSAPPDYQHMPIHGYPPQAYAFWGRRVLAVLSDTVFYLPLWLVSLMFSVGFESAPTDTRFVYDSSGDLIGTTTSSGEIIATPPPFMVALFIATLILTVAFGIWNQIIRQGKTGSSLGKQLLHITVISETTGRPIGAGNTLLRLLAHFLDGAACYLGYLWPLWDPKRQTFADKLLNTVVVSTLPGKAPPIGQHH